MTNIALSMIETAADTLKAYTADLFEKKLIDVIDVQYMRDAASSKTNGNTLIYNTVLGILTYHLLIERKNGGSAIDIATDNINELFNQFTESKISFNSSEDFYNELSKYDAAQIVDLPSIKIRYGFAAVSSNDELITLLRKETKPLIYFKTGTGIDKLCFRADFFSEFNSLQSCMELKNNNNSLEGFETASNEDIATFVKANKGDKINDEQLAAIINGCKNHISIITGGPGTGKTTTITMLLRALLHFGDAEQIANEIVLAAPTGRAAQRISEAVRNEIGSEEFEHADLLRAIPSKTIHDLLRQSFSTELTFRHNATNILHYKTIIIDEASMIDNKLFESFLDAVDKNSRIVIVGDPQQLPSVNAGNMLHTMIMQFNGDPSSITRLTKTYRASGGVSDIYDISRTKQLLEQQKSPAPADGKLNYIWDEEQIPYCFYDSTNYRSVDYVLAVRHWINKMTNETELGELINQQYNPSEKNEGDTHTKLVKILKLLEESQVLSVLRNGLEGCNYINEKLFEAFCRQEKQRFPSFYPIIITQNNSALELTNGQMGIVLRGENNRYHAYFLDGEIIRSVPYDNLPAFEKAYVITVHKSQGSQYKNVLLLLPSTGESPLLTRSIVYTAVTRAKKTVTVIGGQAALDAYNNNTGARTTIWS